MPICSRHRVNGMCRSALTSTPMPEIAPEELLEQLTEYVMLLGSSREAQLCWCNDSGFPPEEMALQLYDAVPGWFDRLRLHGLMSADCERALEGLSRFVREVQPALFAGDDGLAGDQSWPRVRELAESAAALLRSDADR